MPMAVAKLEAPDDVSQTRHREYANLWGSLRSCCGRPVVVCEAEAGIASTEGVFERIVQHVAAGASVTKQLQQHVTIGTRQVASMEFLPNAIDP